MMMIDTVGLYFFKNSLLVFSIEIELTFVLINNIFNYLKSQVNTDVHTHTHVHIHPHTHRDVCYRHVIEL